jgi:glycosyltransferase involved in cell wall biosynthesis
MANHVDGQLHIWLVSPYHTGSHRAWAEGYRRHSRHAITLLTMPGRFWKWRMQGGALELAQQAETRLAAGGVPDAILATDMLNAPTWLGLLRAQLPAQTPLILYMHENQLTYPVQAGEKRDLTYAMINWLSQCASARVLFNSRYHLESWFEALPNLLKHYPDFNHLTRVAQARARSLVLPVGLPCAAIRAASMPQRTARSGNLLPMPTSAPGQNMATSDPSARQQGQQGPLILWNQRWEYDKQPAKFFELLYALQEEGIPFRVAVAGENFRNVPEEFLTAQARLGDAVVHWGFLPNRAAYLDLLGQADLVVSTAIHEFFGISIMEAIAAGAFPLLPNRLSYPELVPADLHPACLYEDEADLLTKARLRLQAPRPAPPSLQDHVIASFDWQHVASQYDACIEEVLGV